MAITSLITGIIGMVLFPIVFSTVALITGYVARRETRSTPPQATGDGMATAGIVLGWIPIGCLGLILLLLVGFYLVALLAGSSLGIMEILGQYQP